MSKSIRSLGKKIKGKDKKKEDKEDNEDFWNAKSQREKINFNSDDEEPMDFLVVENSGQKNGTSPASRASDNSPVPPSRESSPNVAVSARVKSARQRPENEPVPGLRQNLVNNLRSPESKSESARLEAENMRLRKQLKTLKLTSSPVRDVHKTLEAFMDRTQSPSLEQFVSRKEKFILLDRAIERNDGNAITRIIIWLKDTLKRDPNLMKDLMAPERAAGMNHYICYLKAMKEYDELSELLICLNRPEEAAYLEYQRKMEQNKSARARSMALEATLKYHFESQRELEFDASLIREQKRLLDLQPNVIENDKKSKLEEPLKETDSVAQTLWYTCLNHYADGYEISPNYLKTHLNICQNTYEWITLTALAKQQNWELLEIMVKKGGGLLSKLSGPKFETTIQLCNLVNILGNFGMPVDKLRKFILAIDDMEDRKSIAYRWRDHQSALESYQKTQDHQGLAKHITEIPDDDQHRAIRKRYENMLRESKNW